MDGMVTWKKGLSFIGTALGTGFTLPLGADPAVGGENDGFRPPELLLVGLAGCTGMDVISILQKKRAPVSGLEVRVHGERAQEHPKRFTGFVVEYVVTGAGVDRAAVEQAVALSAEKYCGVMATLSMAGPVERRITIREE
jgi:putative redox protein